MPIVEQVEYLIGGITQDRQIHVKRETTLLRDGVAIAPPQNHRYVLEPGTDVSEESEFVQQIAAVAWTPEILAAWEARRAAENPPV